MEFIFTCIKGKSKGVYKNTTPSVVTEETPIDNPIPIVDSEIDITEVSQIKTCSDLSQFDQLPSYLSSEHNDLSSEHNDFDSIVLEVRKDIAEGTFLDKFLHYMDLLKVNRYELDSFLDYEFDFNNPENFEIKVLDGKVFDRLFELYCPDTGFVIPPQTNHYLREYIDRLEPDGRYFPKKQLSIFGEGK